MVACSRNKVVTLKPYGYEVYHNLTIEKGDLVAVFVDNSEMPPYHRAGYNGIAELYHLNQNSSLLVPAYAGFNLEHIFSGDSLEQLFEPRVNPMKLYKKSGSEVLLHQEKTPVSGVETLTRFKMVEPHYIDIIFSCILHDRDYFKNGYAGFFWASYINEPPDKSIYFRGVTGDGFTPDWIQAFSESHGIKSTHVGMDDEHEFYFAPNFRISLASNFSDYRFSQPFYFGRFHNMALAFFFDSSEVIRFTQSPTGGGRTNPAWDFQYLIPGAEPGKEYSFKARIVYKPFVSEDDIEHEYKMWIKNK